MSRAAAGPVITSKPTSDIYTVLVLVAVLAELIAFVVLYLKANEIFIESAKSLFG